MAPMSTLSSLSNTQPSSEGRVRQCATAWSHSAPLGANSRPARYSSVVSSGAIMPKRAPISIDRLHRLRRASIDRLRIVGPANSTAEPAPAAAPRRPIRYSMMSLDCTPSGSVPVKVTRMRLGLVCGSVCVART